MDIPPLTALVILVVVVVIPTAIVAIVAMTRKASLFAQRRRNGWGMRIDTESDTDESSETREE